MNHTNLPLDAGPLVLVCVCGREHRVDPESRVSPFRLGWRYSNDRGGYLCPCCVAAVALGGVSEVRESLHGETG